MHPGISWMGSVEFEELLGRQTKVGARLDQLQTSLGPTGPIILEDTSSSDSNVYVLASFRVFQNPHQDCSGCPRDCGR